jgi:hydroxymethylpyrimidine/phosphomethylpyrimidine kinase
MLPTEEVIREVASQVSSRTIRHVVVDPVVRSTSGYDLIDDAALGALVETLFPLASVVTPNRAEAERITGLAIGDRAAMEQAAGRILALGPGAVLIKGGDMAGDTATDILLDEGGAVEFVAERVNSTSTHGTGCTLGSAIASRLALGSTLREAVAAAKQYVTEAIKAAPGLGLGHGPLNHFLPSFNQK